MLTLSIYLVLSGVTVLLAIAAMPIARKLGLVDTPSERKQHMGDIPLIGGIVIFVVFTSAEIILGAPNWPLIGAMGGLVVLGSLDDRYDLRAWHKLAGQTLAALFLMINSDLYLVSLGSLPSGDELLLGIWGFPLTLIAIIGLANAFNMIDGIDGLAGGLAIMALAHLILAMHLIGRPLNSAVTQEVMIFGAALIGFFVLNLNWIKGRKIFLGDAGSMMIGLFIAYHLILASQRQPFTDTLPTSLVPWIVALPVLDTLSLIYRRLRQGRSPLSPDRTHLHHLLLNNGLSPRLTLIVMLVMADILFWSGFIISRWNSLFAGVLFVILPIIYYRLVAKRLSAKQNQK